MSAYAGPEIVNPGLVLHLDAGSTRSYPGSGTTWTDLSGNGYNATSVGSPTFTSNYFTLNGSSQYFTLAATPLTSVTTCTMLMWIFNAAAQTPSAGLFFSRNASSTSTPGMNFQFNNPTRLGWTWNNDPASYNYDTGLTITQGSWSMVAVSVGATSTTHWVNTDSNTQSFTTVAQTFDTVNIGRESTSNGRYFNGRIGVVNLYNRALSAAEIRQNFNALRGRYGI
jgi:hypothetical protein